MSDFYVYFLRRPDLEDPFELGMACPFYVGKGKNGRKNTHRWEAENLQYKPGRKDLRINIIHKLWKSGLDFEIDVILDNLAEEEAFEYEKEAILAYGRIDLKTGCLANLTDGGEGMSGHIPSEETLRKIRESLKNHGPRRIGWKLTEETKQNIREAVKRRWDSGYKHSDEALKKISETHKGRKHSEEAKRKISQNNSRGFLGKTHTEEERKRISERYKGNTYYLNLTEDGKKRIAEAASRTHKGKIVSEETRRKLSEANSKTTKGRIMPKEIRYKISETLKKRFALLRIE